MRGAFMFCGWTGIWLMIKFDLQLVHVMRSALEEVMTRVPVEFSTPATKAYIAEYILKAAAQGQSGYDGFVASATDQIQEIMHMVL